MSDFIQTGDIVHICFNNETIYNLKIIYLPTAERDYFTMKNKKEEIYNIKNYNYMIKAR